MTLVLREVTKLVTTRKATTRSCRKEAEYVGVQACVCKCLRGSRARKRKRKKEVERQKGETPKAEKDSADRRLIEFPIEILRSIELSAYRVSWEPDKTENGFSLLRKRLREEKQREKKKKRERRGEKWEAEQQKRGKENDERKEDNEEKEERVEGSSRNITSVRATFDYSAERF